MAHHLTDEMIAEAKKRTRYGGHTIAFGPDYTAHHEHNDCIRIAYEWLDAQKKLTGPNPRIWGEPIKHMIERWAGRYVSQDDVAVAAELHPDIKGLYPRYNIASKLTLPSQRRLANIGQAGQHPNYYESFEDRDYGRREGPSG